VTTVGSGPNGSDVVVISEQTKPAAWVCATPSDATGNRQLDSLQNMLRTRQVGVLFMIPGMTETLRVNGSVRLTRDPELLQGLQTGGRPAALALILDVVQVYLHCANCIIRSGQWRAETWPDLAELPSAAVSLNDHVGLGDLQASAEALLDSYTNRI
jgi:predicted pyridoxine 5'-phosphate oxidase superfamily flavin-nucleotide-binding protein